MNYCYIWYFSVVHDEHAYTGKRITTACYKKRYKKQYSALIGDWYGELTRYKRHTAPGYSHIYVTVLR